MTKLNTTSNQHLPGRVPPRGSHISRLLIRLISWYQLARTGRVAPCRFYPSCSQYALEAITTHGALRGSGLALRRLSKCRPLGPHGIDLVPVAKKDRKNTP